MESCDCFARSEPRAFTASLFASSWSSFRVASLALLKRELLSTTTTPLETALKFFKASPA